jgi:hypothetical protein
LLSPLVLSLFLLGIVVSSAIDAKASAEGVVSLKLETSTLQKRKKSGSAANEKDFILF